MNNVRLASARVAAIFFTGSMVFLPLVVSAESNTDQAKRAVSSIRSEVRKIKKLLNRSGVRAQLARVSASTKDFRDSDSDGLPDVIENIMGTDSCGSDSDNDGISDGDESRGGSRPDDSSAAEVELKGSIATITNTTVTVGTYTFTVTDTTRFDGGTSLVEFKVGDYVEVSGRLVGGTLTLRKISKED